MSDDDLTTFVPTPSWLTQPFWDLAARDILSRQRCVSCGHEMFPPQFACAACLATGFEWVASTGQGRLYSFSLLHVGVDGKPLPEPTILADVDLYEGWHMLTHIVNCSPDDVRCDMDVAVTWKRLSDVINLPVFEPVGAG